MDQVHPTSNIQCIGSKIYHYDSVKSTNDTLLTLLKNATEEIPEGTIVLAEEQTSGRGRLGRSWQSPADKGIWMSIYLQPKFLELSKAFLITFSAAVAVAQAAKDTCDLSPQIKWPNDVLLNGRKFCGILTETKSEGNTLTSAVLGIGINVNQEVEDFNDQETSNATSIRIEFGDKVEKEKLIRHIIEKLNENYSALKCRKYSHILDFWKKYATFLGNQVTFINGKTSKVGIAKGVDENGGIVLECNSKEFIFYNGSLIL